jgi:3-oxoacyl-[acyl-carrier protein] reductase
VGKASARPCRPVPSQRRHCDHHWTEHGQLASTAAEIDAQSIVCDATDSWQVTQMTDKLGADLDVVVNMAGGNTDFDQPGGQGAHLEHVMMAWRANLDANLLSAVLTTTAVLDKLRSGGSIINIGSIAAEYASTSYDAAKAALAAWTAGLASQVGPKGLTANVIAPGYIAETEFLPWKAQRSTASRADRRDPQRTSRAPQRYRRDHLLFGLRRRTPHHRAGPACQRRCPHHQMTTEQDELRTSSSADLGEGTTTQTQVEALTEPGTTRCGTAAECLCPAVTFHVDRNHARHHVPQHPDPFTARSSTIRTQSR